VLQPSHQILLLHFPACADAQTRTPSTSITRQRAVVIWGSSKIVKAVKRNQSYAFAGELYVPSLAEWHPQVTGDRSECFVAGYARKTEVELTV
jgi:hypothetical protein